MKTRVLVLCLLAVGCLLGAIPAAAAPSPLPPAWPTTWDYVVDDPNMSPTPQMYPESYVATQDETGMITDLYVVGDSYTVFVNGAPVLVTPVVPDWTAYEVPDPGCSNGFPPCPYTTDPNVAWANPAEWSTGSFSLKTGDVVTIEEDTLPSGYTDGTYAITATTPEPTSIALFGSGLLGLFGTLRRRLSR